VLEGRYVYEVDGRRFYAEVMPGLRNLFVLSAASFLTKARVECN